MSTVQPRSHCSFKFESEHIKEFADDFYEDRGDKFDERRVMIIEMK